MEMIEFTQNRPLVSKTYDNLNKLFERSLFYMHKVKNHN